MYRNLHYLHRQQGIALITVLLILTLATVAAVAMTNRQQLDIRRTSNILQIEQAYMALLAAEELARALLIYDATNRLNQNIDSYVDFWAFLDKDGVDTSSGIINVGAFAVKNAKIIDLQGRFNINNLISSQRQTFTETFQRLLNTRNSELPRSVVNATIDWLDDDDQDQRNNTFIYGDGLEDQSYSSFDYPFLAANQNMASASEILRFAGIDLADQDYDCKVQVCLRTMLYKDSWLTSEVKLSPEAKFCGKELSQLCGDDVLPMLTALPVGQNGPPIPINVNMVKAPQIYQALVPGLLPDEANELVEDIRERGNTRQNNSPLFRGPDAFLGHDLISPHVAGTRRADIRNQISVSSNYFLLTVEAAPIGADEEDASKNQLTVSLNSILYRHNNTVRVIHRSFGKSGEI